VKAQLLLLFSLFVPAVVPPQPTAERIADELLAADRAYAAAAAKTDLVGGIAATFAPEVAMLAPGGILYGSQQAIDALKANPANTGAKMDWTPARVGLSADGRHGFTAGFMTIHRADGSTSAGKYLTYWEKRADGWKALAYKRNIVKSAPPSIEVSYLLPKQIVATKRDAAAIDRDRETLANAERAFAAEAQTIGLGPAFKKYGSPDAINLGGPDRLVFVTGNEEIANSIAGPQPPNTSPVNWGPEKTIIAASGDFGVTIGYIVRNQPGADGKAQPGQPFFTIWQKDANGVWKYIAE
jgi:ketosteroid isomerase-like protein